MSGPKIAPNLNTLPNWFSSSSNKPKRFNYITSVTVLEPSDENIGAYSVHLKSNLITHGDKEAETAKNIQKREVAVTQLVAHVHNVIESTMLAIKGIVIGGDFNTNHDQEMFAAEKTLDSLIGAGYENGFGELPLSQRITHPGTHGFPDATFDFLFTRDLQASPPIVTQTNASDHWPVTRNFRLR